MLAYYSASIGVVKESYDSSSNSAAINCRLYPNRCSTATLQTIERHTYAQPATTTIPIVIPPAVVTPVIVQPVVVTNPDPVVNVINNNTNNNVNNNNVYVNGSSAVSGYANPVYIETPSFNYQSYNYNPTYPTYPDYYETHYNQQPYFQTNNYAPVSVTCSPNALSVPVGIQVLWTAQASGGSGYYSYSWSGTDGVYGFDKSVQKVYDIVGPKGATVTVTSGNQTAQAYCPFITVGSIPVYQPIQGPVQNNPVLISDIACYATPSRAKVGQTVTWTLMSNGSVIPYHITWNGSDGLSGSQPSVAKKYSTAGTKKADITMTAADGKISTRSCGVAVVTANTVIGQSQGVKDQPTVQASNNSGLLSLDNVPWGWIVFLIIIVLIIIIIYLITNNKPSK